MKVKSFKAQARSLPDDFYEKYEALNHKVRANTRNQKKLDTNLMIKISNIEQLVEQYSLNDSIDQSRNKKSYIKQKSKNKNQLNFVNNDSDKSLGSDDDDFEFIQSSSSSSSSDILYDKTKHSKTNAIELLDYEYEEEKEEKEQNV